MTTTRKTPGITTSNDFFAESKYGPIRAPRPLLPAAEVAGELAATTARHGNTAKEWDALDRGKASKKGLTRRQRIGLGVATAAGLTAGAIGLASNGEEAVPQGPVPTERVVAQPGDTPWEIAEDLLEKSGVDRDDVELRPLVDEVQRAAGDDGLQAGEVLEIPVDKIPGQ